MKHQQNNDKEVSAIAFMRSFDETMNLMESIGERTAEEQQTLQESAVQMENYTDDEGVFSMGSLLDVDVADTEENQPRMYNSPVEDLTDSDKQLIVDEFAEQLSKMHEEVIDFSDVGPIATVIQDKFGFKQNLEDFLTGLMTSAADKQDSQSFAHGKPIPGVAAAEMAGTAGVEEGGPTDIEPEQAGPDAAVGETEVMPPVMDEVPAMDVEEDLAMGAEEVAMAEEGDTMEGEPLREPEVDETEAEQVVEDVTGMEIPEGDVVSDTEEMAAGLPDTEEEEEVESAENIAEEEGEEEETGEPSLELQLEAIREKHLGGMALVEATDEELSVDAQLEAIRDNLLEAGCESADRDDMMEGEKHKRDHKMEGDYASTQDHDDFDKKADVAEEMARDGADTMKDEGLMEYMEESVLEAETEDNITAQLESIASEYHAKEVAKVEAIEAEKQLDAQLEAIAGNYHAGEKAKLEAAEAEAKLDEKLSTLVESYHKEAKSLEKANIEARKEVKEKISKLSE